MLASTFGVACALGLACASTTGRGFFVAAPTEGPAAADGRISATRQTLETPTTTTTRDMVRSPINLGGRRDARGRRPWQDRDYRAAPLRDRDCPHKDFDGKSLLGNRKWSKSAPSARPIWRTSTASA